MTTAGQETRAILSHGDEYEGESGGGCERLREWILALAFSLSPPRHFFLIPAPEVPAFFQVFTIVGSPPCRGPHLHLVTAAD